MASIYLTGAECGDIAITAAEGGIGYWSQIDSYKPDRWDGKDVADDFVFYTLRQETDDNGAFDGHPLDVTPAVIRKGYDMTIGKMLFPDNDDRETLLDLDAGDADAIIQFGLFGELVYS